MSGAAAKVIEGVPQRVLDKVQHAINELRWCAQRMRECQETDARLGLGGRLEAEFFQARAKDITKASADLVWFRAQCVARGHNADAIIVAFGGHADITPSAAALEYLAGMSDTN